MQLTENYYIRRAACDSNREKFLDLMRRTSLTVRAVKPRRETMPTRANRAERYNGNVTTDSTNRGERLPKYRAEQIKFYFCEVTK